MSYAGPIAAALMLIVMAGGVTWRLERSRQTALEAAAARARSARRRTSRKLDAALRRRAGRRSAKLLLGARCAAKRDDIGVALRCRRGRRRARRLAATAVHPATLAEALGGDALLPMFGRQGRRDARRGVRAAAKVTRRLRKLADGRGQLVLMARERDHAGDWRDNARVLTALLAATALILGGCVVAFWLDAERAREKAKIAALRRANLDLAMRHGRCGLWSWDLAPGASSGRPRCSI